MGVHYMEPSGERRALSSKHLQGFLLSSPALSHPILHHSAPPSSHLEPDVLMGLERVGSGHLSDEQLGGLEEKQLLAALNPHLIMRNMCGRSCRLTCPFFPRTQFSRSLCWVERPIFLFGLSCPTAPPSIPTPHSHHLPRQPVLQPHVLALGQCVGRHPARHLLQRACGVTRCKCFLKRSGSKQRIPLDLSRGSLWI